MIVGTAVGTGCSSGSDSEPATSTPQTTTVASEPSETPDGGARRGGGVPGGVTTAVGAPAATPPKTSTSRRVQAARQWMGQQGGDAKSQLEPYLAERAEFRCARAGHVSALRGLRSPRPAGRGDRGRTGRRRRPLRLGANHAMAGKRVALALGSGGARGYAHIEGDQRAASSVASRSSGIAGSSMGCLVGGLQAAGKLDDFADGRSR